MTLDQWLKKHPYLEPMARLDQEVEREIAGIPLGTAGIPGFDYYLADYVEGVPLLQSKGAAIDLNPVEETIQEVIGRLRSRFAPGALCERPVSCGAISEFLEDGVLTPESGMMHYLGSKLTSRYLRPVIEAFSSWRQEDRWLRHYCPVCGSAPAMGQLVGADPGRLRLLACGYCGTRWRYRRTGCPFCRNEDDHRLAAVAVKDQVELRIDYCEHCRGYLKTYDGQGSEGVFLADWTSIQLDVVALDRGLKRLAASVYML